jgi:tetratricopeptide (TPR) repeat protein
MSLPDLQEPLALLEQKNYDEAVDVLVQKVAALPAHLGAHVLLAYAHEGREQWEEALESWEEVHFLLPNSPIASAGKQRVLRRMDGIDDEAEAPRPSEVHPPRPADAAPYSSATDEGETDELEEDVEEDTVETDQARESEDTGPDEPSSAADDELAELRRQAEQEARQGGARPGLADKPSSTPEEQVEQFEEEESSDDLNQLIDKLESARIEPDPDAEEEAPPVDPPPDDDTEEVVSETLARIHEGQDDYEKAAHIYAQLAEQEPHRADEFQQKAQEMERKADANDDPAA